MHNDFYVDDGLTSLQSEPEAIKLVSDAQTLCNNGGIRLHKFSSNRRSVIESIPVTERADDVKNLNLNFESLPVERALGLLWNVEQDTFQFCVSKTMQSKNDMTPTTRNMLSMVASVFDPLGLLSPAMLTEKKILQHMCQNGIGWDDLLPATCEPDWSNWLKNLLTLGNVQIPRCLISGSLAEDTFIELHHFSDPCSCGYGQCSYIRLVNKDNIHCVLLIGKARVAPLTVVTSPRLELTAALLSVKMSE